jgi:integrase
MKTEARTRHTGSLRLHPRSRTWYARVYVNGKQIEKLLGIPEGDRPRAERALAKLVKEAAHPEYRPPAEQHVKFEDLVALVCTDAVRKNLRTAAKLGTPAQPGAILRHLAERFGGWRAHEITTEAIEAYTDEALAAGAAVATVNRRLACLRRMFSLAVKRSILRSRPHIPLRSEAGNERQGFVEPADLDAFLTDLRTRDAVAADVTEAAFLTLLRRSNLLGLQWSLFALDVHDGHVVGGELRLPGTATKNKKPLTLPLSGRLLALIDRRYQVRVPACPFVFHRDGHAMQRFDGPWRQATAALGMPGLLLHDLRRSGARALRRAGIDEQTIMALGGWKTPSMFRRYAIVDTTDLADAQAAMTAAFAAPRKVVPLRKAGA